MYNMKWCVRLQKRTCQGSVSLPFWQICILLNAPMCEMLLLLLLTVEAFCQCRSRKPGGWVQPSAPPSEEYATQPQPRQKVDFPL